MPRQITSSISLVAMLRDRFHALLGKLAAQEQVMVALNPHLQHDIGLIDEAPVPGASAWHQTPTDDLNLQLLRKL